MVYQKRNITTDGIYHILNKGVDGRKIFLNDKDYLRFIHDLFEFNDTNPVNNITYFFRNNKSKDIARPYINKKPRELLVEILAFCLMPTHYHLLLKPRFDDGISRFMKKLNMGYAKYFNEKYKREGTLFQNRFKSIAITNDAHFIHLPYYIHYNPLDLIAPEWRERKISDYGKATQFLKDYRWSSHLDYLGNNNFPSVTQRDFLLEVFGGNEKYRSSLEKWLKSFDSMNLDKEIVLE